MAFPAEQLIGKYVYVIRRKLDAGLLCGGWVRRVDEVGRVIVHTQDGVLALPMSEVTKEVNEA